MVSLSKISPVHSITSWHFSWLSLFLLLSLSLRASVLISFSDFVPVFSLSFCTHLWSSHSQFLDASLLCFRPLFYPHLPFPQTKRMSSHQNIISVSNYRFLYIFFLYEFASHKILITIFNLPNHSILISSLFPKDSELHSSRALIKTAFKVKVANLKALCHFIYDS